MVPAALAARGFFDPSATPSPRSPPPRYHTPQHGNGVWAPSLRYHDGKAYLVHAWAKSRAGARRGGYVDVDWFPIQ